MRKSIAAFSLCFITLSVLSMAKAAASTLSTSEIKCHTHNKEKVFTLSDKFLTFNEESMSNNFIAKRIISSSNPVKTKISGKGIVQTMTYEGNNHKIVIKDLKGMSEMSDYLSITSPKGHEMTYPITCAFLK